MAESRVGGMMGEPKLKNRGTTSEWGSTANNSTSSSTLIASKSRNHSHVAVRTRAKRLKILFTPDAEFGGPFDVGVRWLG